MLDKFFNSNALNEINFKKLFDLYLNPFFETLKQREIDLFIFSKLTGIGYLKKMFLYYLKIKNHIIKK